MPFGHGIGNPDDHYPGWYTELQGYNWREKGMNMHVKSGPGYTLSANPINQTLEAEVHNSSFKEPALTSGAVYSVLITIVAGVNALFPNLIPASAYEWLLTILAISTPFFTAMIARKYVWSPASVSAVLKEAIESAESIQKK
jgi:hypothetical protein